MIDIKKEMLFWNGIMRDHGMFQVASLNCKEKEMVNVATKFQISFATLHDQVLAGADPKAKIKETKELINEFVQFKKNMLSKLLTCNIDLVMTPTFLNDMINEALEYYLVLCLAEENIKFNINLETIRLHKIWLFDAAGHAYFIASQLDAIEDMHIKASLDFHHNFNALYVEATQLSLLYERTSNDDRKLNSFNLKVRMLMESFIDFLKEIKLLRSECKILSTGTFTKFVADHMIREELYYLSKMEDLSNR